MFDRLYAEAAPSGPKPGRPDLLDGLTLIKIDGRRQPHDPSISTR